MPEKSAVLAKFNNPYEAHIMRGMLEANGIFAGVLEDSTATALLGNHEQGKVRVVVLEQDLDRARQLLNAASMESDIDTPPLE